MARRILINLLLLLPVLPLSATTFLVPSDDTMVRKSHSIVVGMVLDSYVRRNADGLIETVTEVSVHEVLKNAGPERIDTHLRVVEPGGVLGNEARVVSGSPRFVDGSEVLLFVRNIRRGEWATTDLVLGKFVMATDEAGLRVAIRDEHDLVAGDQTEFQDRRRDAERFLQWLRDTVAGNNAPDDYDTERRPINWRRMRGSSFGTSGSGDLSGLAVSSSSPTAYTMDMGDGRGGRWNVFPAAVTWVSPNALPNASSGGTTAINRAMAMWNNDCPSNVNYVYSGISSSQQAGLLGAPDNINSIRWEIDLSSMGVTPYSCSAGGVLGIGGISKAANPHEYKGESFWTAYEGDVDMNKGLAACGASASFEQLLTNTAAHELGHSLGFRHSDHARQSTDPPTPCADPLPCSTFAIMRSSIPQGITALQQWDLDAVRTVYSATCQTTAVRVRGDLNRDQRSDIVWRNIASGQNAVWFMNGMSLTGAYLPAVVDSSMRMAAIGDLNGDGAADIVWRNISNGDTAVWLMNGASILAGAFLPRVELSMQIAGAGDLNGDGKADVIWRNNATGQNAVWFMNGTAIASSSYLVSTEPAWRIAAIGDFNGDGRDDIAWRNSSTGQNSAWLMNGTTISGNGFLPLQSDQNWQIAGTADLDANGTADLVWRNAVTGQNAVWYMNGISVNGTLLPSVNGASWTIAALGDFNGDGRGDVFWRNTATGETAMWLMGAGGSVQGGYLPILETTWSAAGPR